MVVIQLHLLTLISMSLVLMSPSSTHVSLHLPTCSPRLLVLLVAGGDWKPLLQNKVQDFVIIIWLKIFSFLFA